ncbi:hypothetical protein EVAR_95924_1 [Eumeta japonica]|uniref:Uncharacterized protein n=1 Tax=Eumeta variegata TaxID=151549 RepID=A0A4C1SZV5_EUMVA|nr:hypothetical protein EVAR_95924_1 [Eumeta japonica]
MSADACPPAVLRQSVARAIKIQKRSKTHLCLLKHNKSPSNDIRYHKRAARVARKPYPWPTVEVGQMSMRATGEAINAVHGQSQPRVSPVRCQPVGKE